MSYASLMVYVAGDARPEQRVLAAIPTMTSGRLIFTSRRIAVFSTPPSGRRARSARSGWMARAES
jgi:hypothetical protein